MTKTRTAQPAPEPEAPTPQAARAPTKTERLIAMLREPAGASVEELSEAFGWLPHTIRAALTGLRKKDHAITRARQGSVTVYRIDP